jgi:hypothetical protein
MTPTTTPTQGGNGWAGWTVWGAGLVVASGAGIATAHGLYEVALAAGTPRALAWLYPLITDGLALVAYATTTRLTHHGRTYAWTIVVTAAGLSGLTQASYLAGGVATAPPALRFAIGAWPALAAATVAHLLYLLATTTPETLPTTAPQGPPQGQSPATGVPSTEPAFPSGPHGPLAGAHTRPAAAVTRLNGKTFPNPPEPLPVPAAAVSPVICGPAITDPRPSTIQPSRRAIGHTLDTPLDSPSPIGQGIGHPHNPQSRAAVWVAQSPAAARAATVARDHTTRHGHLPTVRELATLARVGRGTAAAALKTLRQATARQPAGKAASDARSDQ